MPWVGEDAGLRLEVYGLGLVVLGVAGIGRQSVRTLNPKP